MQIRYYGFLLVGCLLWLASCNPQSEAPTLLKQAELLVEEYPDSALKLIDSIALPERSLSKEQYMEYLVRRVQVYYKNYRDITKDTLIFDAARYYEDHDDDPAKSALAQLYAGCVYKEKKEYDTAMEYHKRAETYAEKSNDRPLQGLVQYYIGDLFFEQSIYLKALEKYKRSIMYYERKPKRQAVSYVAVGRMFMFKHKMDSAFYYFHVGGKLAEKLGDKPLKSLLNQNMGVAYEEAKEYKEAEKHYRKAFLLNTDTVELLRYYLNFAEIFDKLAEEDSALVYVGKLKEKLNGISDNPLKASACLFLTEWERKHGNNTEAFKYQDIRLDVYYNIMKAREKQSIYEAERKYDFEQIQKQYYQDVAVRQGWLIVLLGMVIVGGASFSYYRFKQKNKQVEMLDSIATLGAMNRELESSVEEKRKSLRRDLLWRFDIAKKVLKLNEELEKVGKGSPEKQLVVGHFNYIVYGENTIDEQWKALLHTFEKARPGYAEKIKESYPDLTEAEFRICILTYADFNVKETALVLQQSPNTIQTRRTSLRHKMGIDGGGDIVEHLDRLFE